MTLPVIDDLGTIYLGYYIYSSKRKDDQTEEIDGAVLVGRPVATMLKSKPVFPGFTLHFCGCGLDLKPEDFQTGIHQ